MLAFDSYNPSGIFFGQDMLEVSKRILERAL
jgi:hypothetical protein